MVKNTKGGNKSKGFARKFLNHSSTSSLRLPQDPLESFALVTKMYGTMCEVMTHDLNLFKCHIRGKFRGRSKRNAIVAVGKWILIGFRDFEAPDFKNTDLLEIYDPHECILIQNNPALFPLISSFLSFSHSSQLIDHDHDIVSFSSLPITNDPSFHPPIDPHIDPPIDSSLHSSLDLDPPIDFHDI